MAEGSIEKTLNVGFDQLWDAIVKYEDYPQFVGGVKSVDVKRPAAGKAHVTYKINVIKDIEYTIELTEDKEAGKVSWHLISSELFKSNKGGWELKKKSDDVTDVRYWVDLEFKISVPGFMLKPLVKSNLPSMIAEFEKRAKRG